MQDDKFLSARKRKALGLATLEDVVGKLAEGTGLDVSHMNDEEIEATGDGFPNRITMRSLRQKLTRAEFLSEVHAVLHDPPTASLQ